jgi:hypothetical protein
MKPSNTFLKLPKNFWASVRLISQAVGYTDKLTKQIKIPTLNQIQSKLERLDIDFSLLKAQQVAGRNFEQILQDYFFYRDIINKYVEPHFNRCLEAKKVLKTHQS